MSSQHARNDYSAYAPKARLPRRIHFVLERPSRDIIVRIWISLYTPQKEERAAEMLTTADRERVAEELPILRRRYPKLLANEGISHAIRVPPANPKECTFSRMSTNYSADLNTRVEPCIFGGNPDCSQCGCAISSGLHWLKDLRLARLLKLEHIARTSIFIGSVVGHFRRGHNPHERWRDAPAAALVQIGGPSHQKTEPATEPEGLLVNTLDRAAYT
jgi:hypothetical protein